MEGVAEKPMAVDLPRFSGRFHGQSHRMKIEAIPHLREYVPDLPAFENPLMHSEYFRVVEGFFVTETDMVMENMIINIDSLAMNKEQVFYHRAGPRSKVCFELHEVRVAIATCGGLCPGINTVIRELIYGLWFQYGVRNIKGIRSVYRGFYSQEPLALDPKMAHHWHKIGGTVLETSRGGFDLGKFVDAIESYGFNQVYLIGGDGTMKGTLNVFEEVRRRGLKVPPWPDQPDSIGGAIRYHGGQTGHIGLHSTWGSRLDKIKK